MDQNAINQLHKDIQTAVEEMCAERGFKIMRAGGTVGTAESVIKYRIVLDQSADPDATIEAERAVFNAYAWKFGYPKSWFGETFVDHKGNQFKIVGVKPTAEKNCLKIMRLSDKKDFVCPVSYAQAGGLKMEAA